jgi:hypothetical protein
VKYEVTYLNVPNWFSFLWEMDFEAILYKKKVAGQMTSKESSEGETENRADSRHFSAITIIVFY